MKKVWPSDEQKAIDMPNRMKRHSTRMKSSVEVGSAALAAGVAVRDMCGFHHAAGTGGKQ